LAAREGLLDGGGVGLWDRRRRSARVLLLGLMSLVVKCWRAVLGVDSEMWIVKFCVFLQEVNLSDVPLSAAGRGNLKA